MSIRVAAGLAAAALLCACAGAKTSRGGPGSTPASVPTTAAVVATGPANAPVARAGTPGTVALSAQQRGELDAIVARQAQKLRARLRYALAAGDDGKARLVVYDGEGLGPDGRHPGKPHDYVVFKILNSRSGEHYDPQQNSIVPPIPPPVQRESPITR